MRFWAAAKKWTRNNEQNCCTSRKTLAKTWRNTTSKKKYWVSVIVSKTDTDATFMRMKEDHMLNGQLKAGYNVQISTCNQFIVNYSIHPDATDTNTLKSHLEQHIESYGAAPKTLVADAGYGSQENLELLESLGTQAYVKYGMFDKQQQESYNNKKPF